jgi:hypothetical protein
MATVYGVNATLKNTGAVNTIDPQEQGGVVKCLVDSRTLLGTETTGDIIEWGGFDIPAGARIVGWMVDCAALGGSCTLTLGTVEDTDEFLTATNFGSAAKKSMANGDGIASSLGFEINAGDGQTICSEIGAGTVAAVKVIVSVYFVG